MRQTDLPGPASVSFVREDPDGELVATLLHRYYDELESRFPDGFNLDRTIAAPVEQLKPPDGAFLVAYMDGRPVGCGAVRKLDETTGEVKRMWTEPAVRGQGAGKQLLTALETAARELGCRRVRLDTSKHLIEAISLYRSFGYQEIPAYNDNPYAAFWFEKWITEHWPQKATADG